MNERRFKYSALLVISEEGMSAGRLINMMNGSCVATAGRAFPASTTHHYMSDVARSIPDAAPRPAEAFSWRREEISD
jgi:hypothetical protein